MLKIISYSCLFFNLLLETESKEKVMADSRDSKPTVYNIQAKKSIVIIGDFATIRPTNIQSKGNTINFLVPKIQSSDICNNLSICVM